jgi:hypothetical protein
MQRLIPLACVAFVACVAVSDSVAGFCVRAAAVVPLYWWGQFYGWPSISEHATRAAVLWHLF